MTDNRTMNDEAWGEWKRNDMPSQSAHGKVDRVIERVDFLEMRIRALEAEVSAKEER